MTLDEFFRGRDVARALFDQLDAAIQAIGPSTVRVSKSQIAYRRRIAFAWAWTPDRYLHGRVAPLVLTVALRRRDESARWKEVVEPAPSRFTHHLELWSAADIDDFVCRALREAWEAAG